MKVPLTINYDKQVETGKYRDITKHKTGLKITFFDIETHVNIQSDNARDYFKLGVIGLAEYSVSGELLNVEYTHVTSITQLHRRFSEIMYGNHGIILAAHNVSFDFQVGDVLTWLKSENVEIDLWYKAMTTTIISGKANKQKLLIIDTMNHWPMSLENVGKAIGVAKMDIDFHNCTDEYLAEYCENDVRVMVYAWETLHKMIYENWGLRPRLTLASTTVNAFKTTKSWELIKSHLHDNVHKDSYRSYFGGRVELFRHGEFKGITLHKLDVNSLYPAVMCLYPYPNKYEYTLDNPSLNLIEQIVENKTLNAHVLLKTPIPQFPKRNKDQIQFPTGTFETWLTSMELLSAIQRNVIKRIYKAHVFDMDNLFGDYLITLTKLKEKYSTENNMGKREITKRLMNSLYGKFAQLGYKTRHVGYVDSIDFSRGKDLSQGLTNPIPYMILNHEKYLLEQNVILPHTQPHIASAITANARNLMWFYFEAAGLRNCYYSDTDSIIVNDEGLHNLKRFIHESELGKLKYEGETKYLRILAKKSYFWGDKQVTKGIPKKAVKQSDNKYGFLSYRSLEGEVFQTDKSIPFSFQSVRSLNEVIPDGYSVKDTWVIPPHYGESI